MKTSNAPQALANSADRRIETVIEENRIAVLREFAPLPVVLNRVGLGEYAKRSCRSPFREDGNPSWGIYRRNDRWYWKDHGNEDGGDEITFIARHEGLDERRNFVGILDRWEAISRMPSGTDQQMLLTDVRDGAGTPDCSGIVPPTEELIDRLCALRGFSRDGMRSASNLGILVFGLCCGRQCFGVTDRTGRILEWRRLDGQMFQAFGGLPERKSHTVRGSTKSWPVGLHEAEGCELLLLVEGIPDLLAAHDIVVRERAVGSTGVIGMLGATARISNEAIKKIVARHVRIVPHKDMAGVEAARRWSDSLRKAGSQVSFVDVRKIHALADDLCDALPHYENYSAREGGITQ